MAADFGSAGSAMAGIICAWAFALAEQAEQELDNGAEHAVTKLMKVPSR